MKDLKKTVKTDVISTFIGVEARIEGTIEFEGTIRVDGRVSGKIHSKEGVLIVGDRAAVQAEITVGSAILMGEVSGRIEARERIESHAPARVEGDLHSPLIAIAEGAVFNGHCTMAATAAPKIAAAPKPSAPEGASPPGK